MPRSFEEPQKGQSGWNAVVKGKVVEGRATDTRMEAGVGWGRDLAEPSR